MKKAILVLFCIAISVVGYGQRFGTSASKDNTGRKLTCAYLTPTYASTLTVTPNASVTYVKPSSLTGAMTLNCATTNAQVCDEVTFIFYGTGSRTITFNTGIVASSSTLVCDSLQSCTWKGVFNGTAWVETSRAKE